eukprot:TRINITY_DN22197_c0_g1_i1.p1 TRINITY_DN22197_c0_g1~~TRINITY_DN22197_c0_g1_i1.p1  ORF type:complete len:347 (-),score=121.20 TRINITY_DN22197_c0_g1_i1:22-1062(-)
MPKSIVFLGTVSGTPCKTRNVSSYALKFQNNDVFLFDCGEGTQHQILKTSLVKSSKIKAIFITHLHGDHCYGLPGLLASMTLHGWPDEGITVVGPIGVKKLVATVFDLSQQWMPDTLIFKELDPTETHSFDMEVHGISVVAVPIQHRIECFGYVLQEPEKRGKLDAKKAKALGAVGKQMGQLSSGKDVELENGDVIRSVDIMGESIPGKKMVFLGDTDDASSIAEHAMDCDVVVHETTFDASKTELSIERGHSTTEMAAAFANSVNAKKMIITHFSVRYVTNQDQKKNKKKKEAEGGEQEQVSSSSSVPSLPASEDMTVKDLETECQSFCENTQVTAAEDLVEIDL